MVSSRVRRLNCLWFASLLAISIAFVVPSWAHATLYAAQYLSYQFPVAVQGMGLHGIAFAQDNTVNIYNPAMVGRASRPVVGCGYGKYYWDDTVSSLGLQASLPETHLGVGLQLLQCFSPGIERYDVNDQPQGTLDAVQRYVLFGCSVQVADQTTVGVSLGDLGENYDRYHYQSTVFNFGVTQRVSDQLILGMLLNNLSASRIADYPIASTLELGLDWNLAWIELSGEWIYFSDGDVNCNGGFQVPLTPALVVRAGSANGDWRCGVGYQMPFVQLDYCFKPHILGDIHLFSLSFLL